MRSIKTEKNKHLLILINKKEIIRMNNKLRIIDR